MPNDKYKTKRMFSLERPCATTIQCCYHAYCFNLNVCPLDWCVVQSREVCQRRTAPLTRGNYNPVQGVSDCTMDKWCVPGKQVPHFTMHSRHLNKRTSAGVKLWGSVDKCSCVVLRRINCMLSIIVQIDVTVYPIAQQILAEIYTI